MNDQDRLRAYQYIQSPSGAPYFSQLSLSETRLQQQQRFDEEQVTDLQRLQFEKLRYEEIVRQERMKKLEKSPYAHGMHGVLRYIKTKFKLIKQNSPTHNGGIGRLSQQENSVQQLQQQQQQNIAHRESAGPTTTNQSYEKGKLGDSIQYLSDFFAPSLSKQQVQKKKVDKMAIRQRQRAALSSSTCSESAQLKAATEGEPEETEDATCHKYKAAAILTQDSDDNVTPTRQRRIPIKQYDLRRKRSDRINLSSIETESVQLGEAGPLCQNNREQNKQRSAVVNLPSIQSPALHSHTEKQLVTRKFRSNSRNRNNQETVSKSISAIVQTEQQLQQQQQQQQQQRDTKGIEGPSQRPLKKRQDKRDLADRSTTLSIAEDSQQQELQLLIEKNSNPADLSLPPQSNELSIEDEDIVFQKNKLKKVRRREHSKSFSTASLAKRVLKRENQQNEQQQQPQSQSNGSSKEERSNQKKDQNNGNSINLHSGNTQKDKLGSYALREQYYRSISPAVMRAKASHQSVSIIDQKQEDIRKQKLKDLMNFSLEEDLTELQGFVRKLKFQSKQLQQIKRSHVLGIPLHPLKLKRNVTFAVDQQ